MQPSTVAKFSGGVAIAILLGFLAGRQQQIVNNQREIAQDIQEIRRTLQSRSDSAAPSEPESEFEMSIEGAAAKGDANAPVVLIEFSDFECPYCGRHATESLPQLDRDYISQGKIRYVFRHFPLTQLHPHAMKAAEAGECARLQEKFWPLHDRLFSNQHALEPSSLLDYARAAGIEMNTFQSCLDGQASATVLTDMQTGENLQVSATPTFFVGFAQKDGTVHVVGRLIGARPYASFREALDSLIALVSAETAAGSR